jgi:hypothetical protein
MNRYSAIILITLLAIFAITTGVSCGSGVKTPKYPGQEVPVGEKDETVSPKEPSEPAGDGGAEGGGAMFDLGSGESSGEGDDGKSIAVPPINSEPLARPLQAPEEEEEASDEEEASGGEESAEEEEAVEEEEEEAEEEWPEGTTHKEKTPAKFKNLGEFRFDYLNPEDSQIGIVNQMIEAIDILSVNEKKYEYAEGFLTPEEEGLSRGDPLFVPEAVPDELRPLFDGEGFGGSIDDELRNILQSQIQADLRTIPIHIIGIMEQGSKRVAIGRLYYTQGFRVSEGGETYFWYSGSYLLGLYGAMISEDLVVLNLTLYRWSPWGLNPVTDPVPRSFHVGIT